MSFTPHANENLDESYTGRAAYIMDYDGGFDDEFESLAVDPFHPTEAKPGSEDKVQMLAARYAAGLPLWHESDCYDHGPEAQEEDDELDLLDELEED